MSAGGLDTVSSPAFTDVESTRYRAAGWWSDLTLSDAVRRNAGQSPNRWAFADDPGAAFTWREFDCSADALAELLAGAPPRVALRQFALRYGQFGGAEHSPLGLTLLSYQEWLAHHQWPHAAARFRTGPRSRT